jgi:peptide/nickel transport system substrate-binding protein
MPIARSLVYESIERVDAPDARTVVVTWRKPYIEADQLFSHYLVPPLPRHLLEAAYGESKLTFMRLPYWSAEFTGVGPYRVRQWAHGSHVLLTANESYVLGRPRIDEIEMKFIEESNALMANLLADAVEVSLGRNLSLEQALQVRDAWSQGTMALSLTSWLAIYPQFFNPNPDVVADVRFRRALLHAIDGQQLADGLKFGMVPVAHAFISPSRPEYKEVESQIVRYAYDPRRAISVIEGLGYTTGPDGMFRDTAGQRMPIEIRATSGGDINENAMTAVADYWQRIGIAMEPVPIPPQQRDRAWRVSYPAFEVVRQPNDLDVFAITRYHGSQSPLPENNYVGTNRTRYRNSEYDALLDKYIVTVPRQERIETLGQIMRHMTEQLNIMGLFYETEVTMIGNRILNITPNAKEVDTSATWNAHEWDIRS